MPRRRAVKESSPIQVQQTTANPWSNVPAPVWTGPLAYNEDMESQFRAGLSLTSSPGFRNHPSQQGSTSMEDTLFEINQTGLSPMWRDPSPAYVDPRVGRAAMRATPTLPFQYVTEPPSVSAPTNTSPISWETSAVNFPMRGRGQASSTARQAARYQSLPGQPAPGEIPTTQGYASQQYAAYPPYPGPLALPTSPLPGPTSYDFMQQDQHTSQAASPTPMLVQLGASQNFLVNNRPARWIQVLDVDPSYQRARTPSPNRAPSLSVYVRAPETEVHYWAVFLRKLTVQELIKRVVQKYGFSDDEMDRVKMAVRVTDNGVVRHMTDEDVRTIESEVPIDVKVTSLDAESEDWQLELKY